MTAWAKERVWATPHPPGSQRGRDPYLGWFALAPFIGTALVLLIALAVGLPWNERPLAVPDTSTWTRPTEAASVACAPAKNGALLCFYGDITTGHIGYQGGVSVMFYGGGGGGGGTGGTAGMSAQPGIGGGGSWR